MRYTSRTRWLREFPCIYWPAGFRAAAKRRVAVLPRRLCLEATLVRREQLRSTRQAAPGHLSGTSEVWMLARLRHERRVAVLTQSNAGPPGSSLRGPLEALPEDL